MQRYQHQPFVVLGVNTDSSREWLRAVQEKEGLTWRSWWDGPPPFLCPADFVQPLDELAVRSRREGATGFICRQWAVQALPTLYLLDHRGTIRYERQGVPPPQELERKIEALLSEISAKNLKKKYKESHSPCISGPLSSGLPKRQGGSAALPLGIIRRLR